MNETPVLYSVTLIDNRRYSNRYCDIEFNSVVLKPVSARKRKKLMKTKCSWCVRCMSFYLIILSLIFITNVFYILFVFLAEMAILLSHPNTQHEQKPDELPISR